MIELPGPRPKKPGFSGGGSGSSGMRRKSSGSESDRLIVASSGGPSKVQVSRGWTPAVTAVVVGELQSATCVDGDESLDDEHSGEDGEWQVEADEFDDGDDIQIRGSSAAKGSAAAAMAGRRGALPQIVVIGLTSLAGPGLFNALTALGGAGAADPFLANLANCLLYVSFGVCGIFGGAAFNMLGNRVLMAVGGLCFAIYTASQWIAVMLPNFSWVAVMGGILLGLGAGWFWTAQGGMTLGYSTASCRGRYISLFWILFNLGGCIGGLIAFFANFSPTSAEDSAAAGNSTYIAAVVLMLLGVLFGMIFLVPPNQVVREDGSRVVIYPAGDWRAETRQAAAVVSDLNMRHLTVLFAASTFGYAFQFNGINGTLFTIRSRGLNSALYWGAEMVGAALLSRAVLDDAHKSARGRALRAFHVVGFCMLITSCLLIVLLFGFEGNGYDKKHSPAVLIDVADPERFWFPCLVFVLCGVNDAFVQTLTQWLIAALGTGDTTRCAAYAGYFKGVQSLAAAVAWGIDLSPACSYKMQFLISWSLLVSGVSLAYRHAATRNVLPDSLKT